MRVTKLLAVLTLALAEITSIAANQNTSPEPPGEPLKCQVIRGEPQRQHQRREEGWTHGVKKVLVMPVALQGDAEDWLPEVEVREMMAGVDRFMRKNSRGLFGLEATITPILRLDKAAQAYQTSPSLMQYDARLKAAQLGFKTEDYPLDVVINPAAPSQACIGAKGAWLRSKDIGTACHEFGHNLGLDHADSWLTADGSFNGNGRAWEYGNPYDTMGSGSRELADFSAYNKWFLGWLRDGAIKEVASEGVYRLRAIDSEEIEEGNIQGLKIVESYGTKMRELWVETREALARIRGANLLFQWSPSIESNGKTQLLDVTPDSQGFTYDAEAAVGRPFYNADTGLKIEVVSTSSAGEVDVIVKRVHSFKSNAGSGEIEGLAFQEDEYASDMELLTSNDEGKSWRAAFLADVAAPGDYVLWVRGGGTGRGNVLVSVDDGEEFQLQWMTGQSGGLSWQRLQVGDGPATFRLEAGTHRVMVRGEQGGVFVDAILLCDDQRPPMAAFIAPIADFEVIDNGLNQSLEVTVSLVEVSEKQVSFVKANSSNTELVESSAITVSGAGCNWKLHIPLPAGKKGQTRITVRANLRDGRTSIARFDLQVIGVLQRIVHNAPSGEVVQLPAGNFAGAITIDRDLILVGAGEIGTSIVGASNEVCVTVKPGVVAVLRNLKITGGSVGILNCGNTTLINSIVTGNAGASYGAGIYNIAGAAAMLQNSAVCSNHAGISGGGIFNAGDLAIYNSTISGNSAGSSSRNLEVGGGGIRNLGQASVNNSTIVLNRAGSGGGINNLGGSMQLGSTIVSLNIQLGKLNPDLCGDFSSLGFNLIQSDVGWRFQNSTGTDLIGLDPQIGPLDTGEGRTWTHPLLAGSPAIDRGSGGYFKSDQTGGRRVVDIEGVTNALDGSDIGAWEYQGTQALRELTLSFDANGRPQLTVNVGSDAWVVEGSSDLKEWVRIGSGSGPGESIIDESAACAGHFYRLLR